MHPFQSPLQLWEFLERTWICMFFQYAFWIHSDEGWNSKVGEDAITECFSLFQQCFQCHHVDKQDIKESHKRRDHKFF